MKGPESLTIATLLKPLQDRPQKSQGADAQQRSLAAKSFSLPTALPPTFSQPPMINVAQDSSINTLLADKSNRVYTLTELNNFVNRFKELAQKYLSIGSINTAFSPDAPAYELTIDRSRLASLGVSFDKATAVLSKLAGGIRVNQTSVPGGLKEVQLINESGGRREIDNLLSCYIKSADGDMVQIRQFADVELISAPPSIDHCRFNRSVKI